MRPLTDKLYSRHVAAIRGFTLVEIMIVGGIIGLLAVIAVPNLVKSRTQSQANACINNLRQIDNALDQLAMEAKLETGASVTVASVNTFIKGNVTPSCPGGGSYTYDTIGTTPTCTIAGHVYLGNDSSNGGANGGDSVPPTTPNPGPGNANGRPFM